ncbi:MAG: FG-GAP-like repeat-containing protein [Caldilineaceae bacterium]
MFHPDAFSTRTLSGLPRPRGRHPLFWLFVVGLGGMLLALQSLPVHAEEPSFAERRPFGMENDSINSVAVGDVNGDGTLDLVTGSFLAQNVVYLNDGQGNFNWPGSGRPFGMGNDNTSSVAVGDVNGDGTLDLITCNTNGDPNMVYLNDGQGNFNWSGSSRPFGTGNDNTSSVAVGDVNGDGALDLVTANFQRQSVVYLNDRHGNFNWSGNDRPFGSGTDNTYSVALGDVNGDGALDIITWNSKQKVVYLNDGQGNFDWSGSSRPFDDTGNDYTQSVAVGDVNGDGALDIITGNHNGKPNMVYLNDGQGNFDWSGSGRPFGTDSDDTQSMAVGDVNGDGALDLVAARGSQLNVVYLNDGHGNFDWLGNERPFDTGNDNTWSVAVADVNGDGALDIVTSNYQQQSVVYLNNGQGNFPGLDHPFGSGTDSTWSVTVGDVNGDGALDIVTGNGAEPNNAGQPNVVYLNDGQGNFNWPGSGRLFGTGTDWTWSVAVGDVNGDGTLDLITCNTNGDPNVVYLNDGQGNFDWPGSGRPFGIGNDVTWSVAVGDMNGDGALDLVTGNVGQSVFYLNDGQGNFPGQGHPFGTGHDLTRGVAVGDVNGDGALDLIIAIFSGQPNMVYLNDGQGNFDWSGSSRPFGTGNDYTQSLAVGDMNGDGALDLITGTHLGKPNMVYLNDGQGNFPRLGHPFGTGDDNTKSIIAGDVNGDGALDLIAGNAGQPNVVYLNDEAGNFPRLGQTFSTGNDSSWSVAVGDVNGDGALDLITGNAHREPNLVYLNTLHSTFGLAHHLPQIMVGQPLGDKGPNRSVIGEVLASSFITIPYTLYDPAGASVAQVEAFYSPDGGGKWLPAVATKETITQNLTTGRSIAHAVAVSTIIPGSASKPLQANLIITNGLQLTDVVVWFSITHANNRDLTITLQSPHGTQVPLVAAGQAQGANFQATRFAADAATTIISSTAPYTGTYQPLGNLATFATEQSSGQWSLIITNTGSVTGTLVGWGLQLASPPQRHAYIWDTFASGFFGQSDNVAVRMVAYSQPFSTTVPVPGTYRYTNSVAGPILWPSASATSFPFRVRGTQVQVVTNTTAITTVANALVYRLPAGKTRGATLLGINSGPFQTNSQGYLSGRGTIAINDTLVALLPASLPLTLTQQLSDTLRLYYTSATPNATGLDALTVTESGVQSLVVSRDNPLLLFDLKVALEWDARKDTQYLAQLELDLRRASELLYDWSNGQMALGEVTVYHDAPNIPEVNGFQPWRDAHIRIYATNRLRPSASQGGVVDDAFAVKISSTKTITFTAGQVRMGAVWNRYGEATSSLGEDWPRALAHELGHYLLFLDDNYLGLNKAGLLITIPAEKCPGVMNNPYSDLNSEFHPQFGWDGCEQTLSQQEMGRSDWETIKAIYAMIKEPGDTVAISDTAIAGPNSLPLAVTQAHFVPPPDPPTTLDVPIFHLTQNRKAVQPGKRARTILYQGNRLIDLGRPVLDQVFASGARPGDELCLYELSAGRWGCKTIADGNDELPLQNAGGWQPDIIVSPVTSTTLTVSVTSDVAGAYTLTLYPVDGKSQAPISLNQDAIGAYTGTLHLDKPALEGYLRVQVQSDQQHHELVIDYALGGNPVHLISRSVHLISRSVHLISRSAPAASTDGQVIVFGNQLDQHPDQEWIFAVQAASTIPNAPSWTTVVGQAYRILSTPNAPSLAGASISFQYLGDDVPPGEESFLRIYFWDGAKWELLPTQQLDTFYNVVSAAIKGPGLYALMSSIEIPLMNAGWNNFAYTVQGQRAVSSALASIDDKYSVVFGYDSAAENADSWRVYGPKAPAWVNDLTAFEFGKGYWIYATEPITLFLKGAEQPALRTAASNFAPPATYYIAATSQMTIAATIDGKSCGHIEDATGPQGSLLGYRIKVAADDGGEFDGCGTLGRMVHFSVDGPSPTTPLQVSLPWDNRIVQAVAELPAQDQLIFLPVITNGGKQQSISAEATDDLPTEKQLFLPMIAR